MPPSSTLDGYSVEAQPGFLLRRAHQRHVARFVEAMAPLDLTPTQFTALLKTVEEGKVSQNQLGRLAAMDPATIQGVVGRLTARGLIRREQDPMDRRTAILIATDEGRALAARAVPIARAISADTLAPLEPAEREQLLALLRRLA